MRGADLIHTFRASRGSARLGAADAEAFPNPFNRVTATALRTWALLSFLFFGVFAGEVRAQEQETYTAPGSATFIVPEGVTQITVEVWGGGGKGATFSGGGNTGGGGGGGGGGYSRSVLTVVPGQTYNLQVGAGSTNENPGGQTWFIDASTLMANGGLSVGGNVTTGASGAALGVGDVRYAGGNGANGANGSGTSFGGGGGSSAGTASDGANAANQNGASAPSGGGNGGNGRSGSTGAGSAGGAPGGGGGGALKTANANSTNAGGNGANGQVVISWSPPSAANSTITASPEEDVVADGSDSSTLTITVRDGNNAVMGADVELFFEITSGTGTLSAGPWTSNASGQATATLTSTTTGTLVVTGYLGTDNTGEALGTASVAFVAPPPDVNTITGTITDGTDPLEGVSVAATGGHTQTVSTNASGVYTLTGVTEGSQNITITPTLTSYTFDPVSRSVAGPVNDDVTGQDFTGTLNTYTITGTITDGVSAIPDLNVVASGDISVTVQTDVNGDYTISNVPAFSNVTITPDATNFTFTPTSISITNLTEDQTGQDFTGTSAGTNTISGTILDQNGSPLSGVTVAATGDLVATVSTNSSGVYQFTGVPNGNRTITITPTLTDATFDPVSITVNNNFSTTPNVTGQDFTGTITASQIRVETASDGSGAVVAAQDVLSGDAITVWAVARDASDNFVELVTDASWSLQNLTGGVVAGDLIDNEDGSATFTGALTGSATIRAASGALTPTESGTITVIPGAPDQLVFDQQPGTTEAGVNIAPAVTVQILDAAGNLVSGDNTTQVSMAIGTNPSSGTLSGTSPVTASGGVASFSDLSIDEPGTGYTLQASSGALTLATSSAFEITATAPDEFTITGTITDGTDPLEGVSVAATGGHTQTVSTNASGVYTLTGVTEGSQNITITPTLTSYTFDPVSRSVAGPVNDDITGQDFTGTEITYTLTVNVTGDGSVEVNGTPYSSPVTVSSGTTLTLEALADAGWEFSAWSGDLSSSNASETILMDGDKEITAAFNPEPQPGISLRLQYENNQTNQFGDIRPHVRLFNDGDQSLNFTDIKIRYWFVSDAPGLDVYNIDWAEVGTAAVNGNFGSIGGQRYVEISFSSDAAVPNWKGGQGPNVFPNGTDTGPIQSRINDDGFANYDQSLHYSWDPAFTSYADYDKITVYHQGALVWGTPPAGGGEAEEMTITQQPATATAGELFSPAPLVLLEDALGNPVEGVEVTVSLNKGSFAGGSTLVVTTNSSGEALFDNLRINSADSGYQLTFDADASLVDNEISNAFSVTAAAPDEMSVAVQPPSSVNAGNPIDPAPAVTVLDPFGNVVSGTEITVSLNKNSFSSGTLTVTTNASGVAAFSDLVINTTDTNYILTFDADAAGVDDVTSSSFNVVSGGAATMTISTQPEESVAGSVIAGPPAVLVTDNLGNPVSGVNVTVSETGNSTTLDAGTLTRSTNSSGIALFNDLRIDTPDSGYQLTFNADAAGVDDVISDLFDVVAAGGSMTLNVQPTLTTAGEVISPALSVTLLDGDSNPIEGTDITVSLNENSFAAGTLNVATDQDGIALFSDLVIEQAFDGYEITFNADLSGVANLFSDSFDVVAAAPAGMAMAQQPTTTVAGNNLNGPPAVLLTDPFGNPVEGTEITVSINQNSIVSGTLTVPTGSNGIAQFSDLVIEAAGTGYQLTFNADAPGVSDLNSASFTINPAAADGLTITTQPGQSTAGSPVTPSPVVLVTDQFGNPTSGVDVTASINKSSFTGGSNTILTSNSSGEAVFSNLILSTVDTGYEITFSASSLSSVTTTSFEVVQPDPEFGTVRLEYRAIETAASSNVIRFGFRITNESGVPLNLDELEIRYWYTSEPPGTDSYTGENVPLGGGNISGTPGVIAGEEYMGLFISENAVISVGQGGDGVTPNVLPDQANTGVIEGRINDSGWANYNQADDYSFDPSITAYTDFQQINVYYKGQLVWGQEPPAVEGGVELEFDQQPTDTDLNETIDPAVTVLILDRDGNTVTGDNETEVTIAIANDPSSGATLNGTTIVTALNGVATFSNLSINQAGTGFTLLASAPDFESDTSDAFNIISSVTYTITGTITDAENDPVEGVTVTATGGHSQTVSTDAAGEFTLTGVSDGAVNITVTPTLIGFTFDPVTRSISGPVSENMTGMDFTATAVTLPADPAQTTISASPITLPSDGSSTSTITVQARDENGDNLTTGGDSVVLSTTAGSLSGVTDNNNGTYTATLTSAASEGTAVITGTINSVAITDDAVVDFVDAAVFTYYPAGLSNSTLRVWFDAADNGMVITDDNDNTPASNGNSVTRWRDKSLDGRDALQTESADRPIYRSAVAFGGRPSLQFNNSEFMPFDGSFIAGTDYTISAVVARSSAKNFNVYLGGTDTGINNNLHLLWRVNEELNHHHYSNDYNGTVAGWDNTVNGEVHLFRFSGSIGSPGRSMFRNGELLATGGTNQAMNSWDGSAIGRYIDASNASFNERFEGHLGEIIMHNKALTDSERILLENYLATKWGRSLAASSVRFTPQTGFRNQLAGIGRVSGSDLVAETAFTSGGLGFSSQTGSGHFLNGDGNYLVAAHNNGTGISASQVTKASGTYARWERVWQIEKTVENGDGTTTLYFDFGDYNLSGPDPTQSYTILFNATDATFPNASTEVVEISGTISGNRVSFSLSSSLIADGFYTLGYQLAASADETTISASPSVIEADGITTSEITVQLKDANGVNITSGGVNIELFTTAGSLGSVTDNGDGTYTAFLTSSTDVETATITGTLDGDPITDSAEVQFVAGAANAGETLITAADVSILADGVTQTVITVQARDVNGSDLTTGGDDVELETTLGTLSGVTDEGDGTYTTTLTSSATAGTAIISGTINSNPITDSAEVLFLPGAADPAESMITAIPAVISANGTSESTILVQLRDANGNSLTSGGDTVTLSTTAGTLSSPVTDNGDGTYTAILTSDNSPGIATVTGTVNAAAITDNATVEFADFVVLNYYPGGIENSALQLWYDVADLEFLFSDEAGTTPAEIGDPIARVEDKSPNARHSVQPTASARPVLSNTGAFGGRNSLIFDNAEYLPFDGSFLAGTDYTLSYLADRTEVKTFNALIGGTTSSNNENLHIFWGTSTALQHHQWGNDYTSTVPAFDAGSIDGEVLVFNLESGRANQNRRTWRNGTQIGSRDNTSQLISMNGAAIGKFRTSDFLRGRIGEVYMYDRALNDTEHIILQNYKAAKWGVSLHVNVRFYEAPAGFDRQLAGIGRVSSADHVLSTAFTSGGLGLSSSTAGGQFLSGNGNYLMAAHNGEEGISASQLVTPSGTFDRWDRVWFVEKSAPSGNGSVTLHFNFNDYGQPLPGSGETYTLLYHPSDNTFPSSSTVIVSSSSTVSGGQVSFTLSTSDLSNGYYTLGILDGGPMYYSRQSGNWNQASTWSLTGHDGAAAETIPGSGDLIFIGGNGGSDHTVTLTGNITLGSGGQLTVLDTGDGVGNLRTGIHHISGSGSVSIGNGATLQIGSPAGIRASGSNGNIRTTSRSFSEFANYIYNGNDAQVTGTGLPQVLQGDLVIENANGVRLTGSQQVDGTLILDDGALIVGSGLSLIANSKQYNGGELQYELTIGGPDEGYRMLSSPIAADFDNFLSEVITQGYPGASLTDTEPLQPNVLWYDETYSGTDNQRWRAPASSATAVTPGRGYFVYLFGDDASDSRYNDEFPYTLIVNGEEHEGTAGEMDLNVTWTETGDQGWNLVGNPFGAAIDWNHPSWTKTNLDATLYVWDPNTNQMYVSNELGGDLEDGIIAPFQAFWVKANAANPELVVNRDAMTLDEGTGYVGKVSTSRHDLSRISLRAFHSERLQSTVHLSFTDEGSLDLNRLDGHRLLPPFMTKSFLEFYTRKDERDRLAISHLPRRFGRVLEVPLELNAWLDDQPVTDQVWISIAELEKIPDEWILEIVNTHTEERIELHETDSVAISMSHMKGVQTKRVNSSGKVTGGSEESHGKFILRITPGGELFGMSHDFTLHPNYPNPFNPSTTLAFDLPLPGQVRLEVYDMLGRRVALLVDENLQAGSHTRVWDAGQLSSGIYIVRLVTREGIFTRKVTLVK